MTQKSPKSRHVFARKRCFFEIQEKDVAPRHPKSRILPLSNLSKRPTFLTVLFYFDLSCHRLARFFFTGTNFSPRFHLDTSRSLERPYLARYMPDILAPMPVSLEVQDRARGWDGKTTSLHHAVQRRPSGGARGGPGGAHRAPGVYYYII